MTFPEKKTGFRQDIYEISATAKEPLGTLRTTIDGRVFRYAQAGSSALGAGKMGQAASIMASVMNKTAVATAVGSTALTLTITAPGTAVAENFWRGGYLQINDAAGEGHQYVITGSTAVTAAGTSVTLTLQPPGIRVALTTASEFTLVHSPWVGVVESATATSLPVGAAPVAVTAAYYYWAQTGGVANVLIGAVTPTPAVGGQAILDSGTAGSVTMASGTWTGTKTRLGTFIGTVGVATEYKPVFLKID